MAATKEAMYHAELKEASKIKWETKETKLADLKVQETTTTITITWWVAITKAWEEITATKKAVGTRVWAREIDHNNKCSSKILVRAEEEVAWEEVVHKEQTPTVLVVQAMCMSAEL